MKTAEAIKMAFSAHLGSFRRDGETPYFEHCNCVAKCFDEDTPANCVAYLHDTIEDGHLTFDDIFVCDPLVASLVKWLTHEKSETYSEYIHRVARYDLTRRIKIADIAANLSDNPTANQVLKYLAALAILMEVESD